MALKPLVKDEYGKLKVVILGTARSMGGTPSLEDAYDPKSKEHIRNGTFPVEEDLIAEIEEFNKVLEKYEVKVYRPKTINDLNQIFSRDIGFVIDDKLVIANVISDRRKEIDALEDVIGQVPKENLIELPDGLRIEGGDVMPVKDYLFIGYSEPENFQKYTVARTNKAAVKYMQDLFPDREVKGFRLNKSDTEPRDNALHLDCCFQPLGLGHALLYEGGFRNSEDAAFIKEFFGKENIITLNREQMYEMQSNLFSIAPDVVVSEKKFSRLNARLRELGYTVEEIKYSETSKMEGLLRCSTFPLQREYNS